METKAELNITEKYTNLMCILSKKNIVKLLIAAEAEIHKLRAELGELKRMK